MPENIAGSAPCFVRAGFRLAAALLLLAVAACGPFQPAGPEPEPEPEQGIFGPRGINLLNRGNSAPTSGAAIGVNAFLWRASLDTVSFMPLASADPFGGVIITDWYTPPAAGGQERFKLSVFILDQRLRADGVKVSVFRQELDAAAGWRDAGVTPGTATDLENAILTRAREMWLSTQAGP